MITAPKCTLSFKVTKQLQYPSKHLQHTMNSSFWPDPARQIPALPASQKSREERSGISPNLARICCLGHGIWQSWRQKLDVSWAFLRQSQIVLCGKVSLFLLQSYLRVWWSQKIEDNEFEEPSRRKLTTSSSLQLSLYCEDRFNASIALFASEGDGAPRIILKIMFSYTTTSCFLRPQIHP